MLVVADLAGLQIHDPESRSFPRRVDATLNCAPRVAAVGIRAFAAGQFVGVPRITTAGRPALVAFLAVVLDLGAHPFDERRKAIPVPLFERVTDQRVTSSPALVGQDGYLVDEVGMLRPAAGNDRADVPDVFAVEPGDDVLKPGPNLLPATDFGGPTM